MDRIRILTEFRKGVFDCIVGVNLLREGLDLPEVTLIGILDADKEGFLRSETSLIQTIGRAARNVLGRVVLYADHVTGSMERAISETNRRRALQTAYNEKHGITPQTIIKHIHDITEHLDTDHEKAVKAELKIDKEVFGMDRDKLLKEAKKRAEKSLEPVSDEMFDKFVFERLLKLKHKKMAQAVKELDFETAAIIRDEIKALEKDKSWGWQIDSERYNARVRSLSKSRFKMLQEMAFKCMIAGLFILVVGLLCASGGYGLALAGLLKFGGATMFVGVGTMLIFAILVALFD